MNIYQTFGTFEAAIKYLSSRLFCEISHRSFARHLSECRTSVSRIFMSRTSRRLVAKVLNMLKILCECFTTTYRKTVARLSCDSRTTFTQVSRTCRREILANLQCKIFINASDFHFLTTCITCTLNGLFESKQRRTACWKWKK